MQTLLCITLPPGHKDAAVEVSTFSRRRVSSALAGGDEAAREAAAACGIDLSLPRFTHTEATVATAVGDNPPLSANDQHSSDGQSQGQQRPSLLLSSSASNNASNNPSAPQSAVASVATTSLPRRSSLNVLIVGENNERLAQELTQDDISRAWRQQYSNGPMVFRNGVAVRAGSIDDAIAMVSSTEEESSDDDGDGDDTYDVFGSSGGSSTASTVAGDGGGNGGNNKRRKKGRRKSSTSSSKGSQQQPSARELAAAQMALLEPYIVNDEPRLATDDSFTALGIYGLGGANSKGGSGSTCKNKKKKGLGCSSSSSRGPPSHGANKGGILVSNSNGEATAVAAAAATAPKPRRRFVEEVPEKIYYHHILDAFTKQEAQAHAARLQADKGAVARSGQAGDGSGTLLSAGGGGGGGDRMVTIAGAGGGTVTSTSPLLARRGLLSSASASATANSNNGLINPDGSVSDHPPKSIIAAKNKFLSSIHKSSGGGGTAAVGKAGATSGHDATISGAALAEARQWVAASQADAEAVALARLEERRRRLDALRRDSHRRGWHGRRLVRQQRRALRAHQTAQQQMDAVRQQQHHAATGGTPSLISRSNSASASAGRTLSTASAPTAASTTTAAANGIAPAISGPAAAYASNGYDDDSDASTSPSEAAVGAPSSALLLRSVSSGGASAATSAGGTTSPTPSGAAGASVVTINKHLPLLGEWPRTQRAFNAWVTGTSIIRHECAVDDVITPTEHTQQHQHAQQQQHTHQQSAASPPATARPSSTGGPSSSSSYMNPVAPLSLASLGSPAGAGCGGDPSASPFSQSATDPNRPSEPKESLYAALSSVVLDGLWEADTRTVLLHGASLLEHPAARLLRPNGLLHALIGDITAEAATRFIDKHYRVELILSAALIDDDEGAVFDLGPVCAVGGHTLSLVAQRQRRPRSGSPRSGTDSYDDDDDEEVPIAEVINASSAGTGATNNTHRAASSPTATPPPEGRGPSNSSSSRPVSPSPSAASHSQHSLSSPTATLGSGSFSGGGVVGSSTPSAVAKFLSTLRRGNKRGGDALELEEEGGTFPLRLPLNFTDVMMPSAMANTAASFYQQQALAASISSAASGASAAASVQQQHQQHMSPLQATREHIVANVMASATEAMREAHIAEAEAQAERDRRAFEGGVPPKRWTRRRVAAEAMRRKVQQQQQEALSRSAAQMSAQLRAASEAEAARAAAAGGVVHNIGGPATASNNSRSRSLGAVAASHTSPPRPTTATLSRNRPPSASAKPANGKPPQSSSSATAAVSRSVFAASEQQQPTRTASRALTQTSSVRSAATAVGVGHADSGKGTNGGAIERGDPRATNVSDFFSDDDCDTGRGGGPQQSGKKQQSPHTAFCGIDDSHDLLRNGSGSCQHHHASGANGSAHPYGLPPLPVATNNLRRLATAAAPSALIDIQAAGDKYIDTATNRVARLRTTIVRSELARPADAANWLAFVEGQWHAHTASATAGGRTPRPSQVLNGGAPIPSAAFAAAGGRSRSRAASCASNNHNSATQQGSSPSSNGGASQQQRPKKHNADPKRSALQVQIQIIKHSSAQAGPQLSTVRFIAVEDNFEAVRSVLDAVHARQLPPRSSGDFAHALWRLMPNCAERAEIPRKLVYVQCTLLRDLMQCLPLMAAAKGQSVVAHLDGATPDVIAAADEFLERRAAQEAENNATRRRIEAAEIKLKQLARRIAANEAAIAKHHQAARGGGAIGVGQTSSASSSVFATGGGPFDSANSRRASQSLNGGAGNYTPPSLSSGFPSGANLHASYFNGSFSPNSAPAVLEAARRSVVGGLSVSGGCGTMARLHAERSAAGSDAGGGGGGSGSLSRTNSRGAGGAMRLRGGPLSGGDPHGGGGEIDVSTITTADIFTYSSTFATAPVGAKARGGSPAPASDSASHTESGASTPPPVSAGGGADGDAPSSPTAAAPVAMSASKAAMLNALRGSSAASAGGGGGGGGAHSDWGEVQRLRLIEREFEFAIEKLKYDLLNYTKETGAEVEKLIAERNGLSKRLLALSATRRAKRAEAAQRGVSGELALGRIIEATERTAALNKTVVAELLKPHDAPDRLDFAPDGTVRGGAASSSTAVRGPPAANSQSGVSTKSSNASMNNSVSLLSRAGASSVAARAPPAVHGLSRIAADAAARDEADAALIGPLIEAHRAATAASESALQDAERRRLTAAALREEALERRAAVEGLRAALQLAAKQYAVALQAHGSSFPYMRRWLADREVAREATSITSSVQAPV